MLAPLVRDRRLKQRAKALQLHAGPLLEGMSPCLWPLLVARYMPDHDSSRAEFCGALSVLVPSIRIVPERD